MDPFAAGLTVLHDGPASAPAAYRPVAGDLVRCRVIVDRQTADDHIDGRPVRLPATVLQIRRVDVAKPEVGATVDLLDPSDENTVLETFDVVAPPQLDVEGLTWAVEAAPRV